MRRVLLIVLSLAEAAALAARTVEPAKSALVILSSTPCVVSLDGQKVAELQADEPMRLELAPADYVLSAVSADGRRWSKVLRAAGDKVIVRIEFPPVAPAAPAAAATAPAAGGAPIPAPEPPSPGKRDIPWVLIPAGAFEMGCSAGDTECNSAELPRRPVRVLKPFEIMATTVTVAQFRDWASTSRRRLPTQPRWSADDVPVVNVTWDEAADFCSAIAARLPAEIEWEYAARAGSPGARYGELDAIAWYAGNSDKRAHPVGRKSANAFGLYDMLGNVWEWNADVFGSAPGSSEDGETPSGSGDMRSLRGGSWRNNARQIRASNRGRLAPDDREDDDGFRCVRDPLPR